MRQLWKPLLISALLASLTVPRAGAFSDVSPGSPLYQEVQQAAEYGLMNGYSNNTFGYSRRMTRAQFAAVLGRMMDWKSVTPDTSHYADVPPSHYWYNAIETAYANGVRDEVSEDGKIVFHPDWPITRYAMCKLMVQAVGLESAADLYLISPDDPAPDPAITRDAPFDDIPLDKLHSGYISVAYAIGLTYGTSDNTFTPYGTATRGQAAAMLVRMYQRLLPKEEPVSAFYSFSSDSQLNLTRKMDVVSVGWSRLHWDGSAAILSTAISDGNNMYVPANYADVVNQITGNGASVYLEVFMDASDGVRDMLSSQEARRKAVEQIVNELTTPYRALERNPYSGVTIHFEGFESWQDAYFNQFLKELRTALPGGKGLYACVMTGDDGASISGDVKAIAEIADKVVLMAWNFDRRQMDAVPGVTGSAYMHNAPAPLPQVFRFIRSASLAASDPSKLALGLRFQNVAWEVDSLGNQIASTPVYPSAVTLADRLKQRGTAAGWDTDSQMPYAYYETEKGRVYFTWYEDAKSVRMKRQAARLLGLDGIVVWRLGSIPNGVIDELKDVGG